MLVLFLCNAGGILSDISKSSLSDLSVGKSDSGRGGSESWEFEFTFSLSST